MCVGFHVQLCGRAERGGMASRAHVFFSLNQPKRDAKIEEYCTSKENCRRQMMLRALSARETHPESLPCCDCCNPSKCPQQLHFEPEIAISSRRKRRTAVKLVDKECKHALKDALLKGVEAFMEEHPSFKMFGRSFVCPECIINKICDEARFFKSRDDFNIVGLRPELRDPFFKIFCNVTANAPAPKRSHIG